MSEQRTVERGAVVVPEATETRIAVPPIADPAPLGLAAFALTTFLLSAQNAGLTDGIDAWLGFALAYGGLCQLLAGMWEFRNRNVFGATAFSTYGGFWIGLGIWFLLIAPRATGAAAESMVQSDLGWILLAFSIFNTYMLLWSMGVNAAVFGVFLTLEATEVILWIGFFSHSTSIIKLGGWIGIITAIVAWYASAAGVVNGMRGTPVVPVGRPFWSPGGGMMARPGSPMPRAQTPRA
jgi:succinate-acetate transporter protein